MIQLDKSRIRVLIWSLVVLALILFALGYVPVVCRASSGKHMNGVDLIRHRVCVESGLFLLGVSLLLSIGMVIKNKRKNK